MYAVNDDSTWKPVKGRSQNKQNSQKSKTPNGNMNGTLPPQNSMETTNVNSFPAPSTAALNGNLNSNGVNPPSSFSSNNNSTKINNARATNKYANYSNNRPNSNYHTSSGGGNNPKQPLSPSSRNSATNYSNPAKDLVVRNGYVNGDPRKAIDREMKSLIKYEANVKNTRWHFEEELKKSEDRLKRAFQEMRDRLNQREKDLCAELNQCNKEGTQLLDQREETGQQLRLQTARFNSNTNFKELEDLRQQIRKFLHEKRLEDELGKTLRFQYEPDKLIECISNFGDVQPIYGRPGAHRQKSPSTTSLVSADGAEVSSIDSSLVPQQQLVINEVNVGGLVIKSDSMDPAQLALLTQQLQESLRMRGITDDILPEVSGSLMCPMPQRAIGGGSHQQASSTHNGGGGGQSSNNNYSTRNNRPATTTNSGRQQQQQQRANINEKRNNKTATNNYAGSHR